MAKYVLSTLAKAVAYSFYEDRKEGNQLGGRRVLKSIEIAGGAGVAPLQRGAPMPEASVTEISDEDAELLSKNRIFNIHKNNGFVEIRKTNPSDPGKASKDLNKKDKSRQKKAETKEEKEMEMGSADK